MTDTEPQAVEPTEKGSLVGRLLIVGFMGTVVMSECLFAYLWLPSSQEVAAQMQQIAEQAQQDAASDKETQADEASQLSEIDLGSFTMTNHKLMTEATFRTDFHLWGTVREEDVTEFTELFERNKARFRDLVIEEIQNCEIPDLVDPGLGLIKRRFLEKSNALLGKPILRSVVFADYTFVEL